MKIIALTISAVSFLSIFCPCLYAEDNRAGLFFIEKVNRIEKLYVIPPERRDFMGSRGLQKFDYQRLVPEKERGENYIVTWRYRGKTMDCPVVMKFEYKLSSDPLQLQVGECKYPTLKTGTYDWTLENIGAGYVQNGKVDRWKVSLISDGKVVAEKRSANWYAMEGT